MACRRIDNKPLSEPRLTWFSDACTFQRLHNGCNGIPNHQPHHCLLNRLCKRRSKKTSKLRITGLCERNLLMTGGFCAQMAINGKNVSICWRRYVNYYLHLKISFYGNMYRWYFRFWNLCNNTYIWWTNVFKLHFWIRYIHQDTLGIDTQEKAIFLLSDKPQSKTMAYYHQLAPHIHVKMIHHSKFTFLLKEVQWKVSLPKHQPFCADFIVFVSIQQLSLHLVMIRFAM